MEIPQYLVKAEREVPSDVLEDAQPRSKYGNPIRYVRPQVPPVGDAVASAGQAERLARIAAGEHVDRGDLVPVDLRDVPEVRHVGPVVREDPRRRILYLAVPQHLAAEDRLDANLKAAVSGEQRAEAQRLLNHRSSSSRKHAPARHTRLCVTGRHEGTGQFQVRVRVTLRACLPCSRSMP